MLQESSDREALDIQNLQSKFYASRGVESRANVNKLAGYRSGGYNA